MPRLLVNKNFPAPATQALLAWPDEIEGYFCVWRRDGMRRRALPGVGR